MGWKASPQGASYITEVRCYFFSRAILALLQALMEVATRPKGARGGALELNIDSIKTALFTLGSFCNYPQCNQLLRAEGLAELLWRRRLPDDPDIRKQSLRILVRPPPHSYLRKTNCQ